MIMLTTFMLAGELPSKPKASDPIPGQCEKAVPMATSNVAVCDGILMPTSWMADYEKISVWSDRIAAQYRLDTKLYQLKIERLERELEILSKPVPFWERPVVIMSTGVIIGSAMVVAGGYAVSKAGGSQ
tara:strand:- start:357 stop:743 length:387 start_codon:yes stop_codon:yes gene_type:complete